jgi:hypothetical protein
MWSLFDLVFPIGLGIVGAVLCIVAAIKTTGIACAICIATGVVFLFPILAIYIMRWFSLKCDFVTKRGLRVRKGGKCQCEMDRIQLWEDEIVAFWSKFYTVNLEDAILVCKDLEKISIDGIERFYRGYSTGNSAVIGWREGDVAYTHSLFRHEISHVIVTRAGVFYNEAAQHALFAEKGLGD